MTKAWDLIGQEGAFRIPGGHTIYDAVMYDSATARSNRVRLVRLDTERGIRQINRYVDADQAIEVIDV